MMSQSAKTKEKLINSAIKIFAKKGFWKTKISDIVQDAGVAQGTFYLYFKSKEDCFKNVLLILHNETINRINLMHSEGKNLAEIIIFFIKRIFQFKEISKVFLFEAISSGEEFKNLYFNFKDNFKKIFLKFYKDENFISIIAGTIREIIEQDILFEGKDEGFVLEKLNRIFKILKI